MTSELGTTTLGLGQQAIGLESALAKMACNDLDVIQKMKDIIDY